MSRGNETQTLYDPSSEPIEHKEPKTYELDDILIEKLEQAFDKPSQAVVLHDLAKIAAEHSPVDLAIAACRLPSDARAVLFQNLSKVNERIKFITNTDTNTRIAVLREISDAEILALIQNMPADEAVEVLEDLSERRYRKVIEALEPNKALRILEIEKSARNTAGRLMSSEFFAFLIDVKIGEVAVHVRNNPGIALTRRIFVVNTEGELLGYVPARNLIVNPPELPLKQVMRPITHKVTKDASRKEVVDLVERYKICALPVVDEKNRCVGVITYEDVLDALEDILDETIGSVAGTAEKVGENEPSFKRFLSRTPWLVVTLIAGLINVGVISTFGKFEQGMFTFLLFFVPLITGMSGNIGIQCSTVLVRSMALGLMTPGNRRESIFKEMLVGSFAGLFFAVFCGVLVASLDFTHFLGITAAPWELGVTVGLGLLGACLTGTLLGVLSPLFFSRVGVDPAVASGPIVTALNDFLSMTIYFSIAIGISFLIL